MGTLLSSLFNPELPSDVVVDFEKIQPPSTDPKEMELYSAVQSFLEQANETVLKVEGYKGNADLIRNAMANPGDEAIQLAMFEGMFPNIERIKEFYNFAKAVDDLGLKLVTHFIESGQLSPPLMKSFAILLNLVLKFDRAKMIHPEIQNDFSQYRRSLQRNQRHPGVPVNDIEADRISMFIAQASPAISSLGTTLDGLQRKGKDVSKFLADFAHICCAFVMREKAHDKTHAVMAMTAMVVSFLLYDMITPIGVFGKGSQIDVKTCVGQLRVLTDVENRGLLCDTLHYSTRSFDKASDTIKRVLESRG